MCTWVPRKDSVKELFISGKFIQSQEWRSLESSIPMEFKTYEYTRDYVKYNDGMRYDPETTYRLKFSKIIHATHQSELLSIINDGGLKPGKKSIPGCTLNSFVWFGMKIGLPEVDEFKNDYTKECQKDEIYILMANNSAAVDCSSIVNSPCFQPISRYGEFKLTFEIRNVIDAYRQQFCRINPETRDWPRPEFRILGTFVYKMEIMHTLLICAPYTPGTDKYPLLDQKKKSVIWKDHENEGTFIWRPDSTGDKDKASEKDGELKPYRRWEHVTFAFYVPDGKILELNDVSSNISVCIYQDPFQSFTKSDINDTIHQLLDKFSEESAIKTKKRLVNLLIRSLRGYLYEEEVFEKMNILHMYQPVDLAAAVYRVEELLVGEEFDWSPLIEWMKDVQQTENKAVLSSILKYLNKMREICTTKLTDNGVPQ